jgi:hypothetical protein
VDWVIWLRIGTVASSCEHSNETLGSIKDEEFLDKREVFLGCDII